MARFLGRNRRIFLDGGEVEAIRDVTFRPVEPAATFDDDDTRTFIEVTAFNDRGRSFVAARLSPAEQEARQRQYDAEQKQYQSIVRSKALLLAHLDDEQRAQFECDRSFVVRVPSGRQYRIVEQTANNVVELDESDPRGYSVFHCAYAPGVPLYDHLLTQKLALQTDEFGFLRKAITTARGRSLEQGVYGEQLRRQDAGCL